MDFPNYRTQFNQNRKEGGRLREGRRKEGSDGGGGQGEKFSGVPERPSQKTRCH